jgi:hypothetical protein
MTAVGSRTPLQAPTGALHAKRSFNPEPAATVLGRFRRRRRWLRVKGPLARRLQYRECTPGTHLRSDNHIARQ